MGALESRGYAFLTFSSFFFLSFFFFLFPFLFFAFSFLCFLFFCFFVFVFSFFFSFFLLFLFLFSRDDYLTCSYFFPFLKVEVWFFSTLKSFWNFLPTYHEFPFYKLIMTGVSRNLRNIFLSQNTPDFESWSWIFVHLEKFLNFFGQIRWIIVL